MPERSLTGVNHPQRGHAVPWHHDNMPIDAPYKGGTSCGAESREKPRWEPSTFEGHKSGSDNLKREEKNMYAKSKRKTSTKIKREKETTGRGQRMGIKGNRQAVGGMGGGN